MGNPLYLSVLLGLFLLSFFLHKYFKLQLFKTKKHFVAYFLFIFFIGLVWDYFSVSQGLWMFPPHGTIGIAIGILPIEEFLFFLLAPYLGLTLYKLLEQKIK